MKKHLSLSLSGVVLIMLMNVKMPTIVGILTFMSRIIFVLSWVEFAKSFITSGPCHNYFRQDSSHLTFTTNIITFEYSNTVFFTQVRADQNFKWLVLSRKRWCLGNLDIIEISPYLQGIFDHRWTFSMAEHTSAWTVGFECARSVSSANVLRLGLFRCPFAVASSNYFYILHGMRHEMWFPTMWQFDKCRLRRACAAFF